MAARGAERRLNAHHLYRIKRWDAELPISSLSYARVGPVHFQPLEWELAPVRKYMRGDLLNAGCGDRDISGILRTMGAATVTNVDIQSNIPQAVLSSLDRMPFADLSFDTILCNAVLEHVESIDGVMAELVRVLRGGGRMIISIPFLQPFHESPSDFRRYTAEGMRQLGEAHGLRMIAIRPVHSIAQTLGWIVWEYLNEIDARLRKAICWPIIWLATRWSCRGNQRALRSANTLQAVYEKAV